MIVIDSSDLAPIITAIAGLVTVIGGIVAQIILTIKQNRKIESNHLETIEEVRNGPSIKETGPGSP